MIVCRVCGHDKLMLRTSLKKLYIQSEELGPMQQKSHIKNYNKSLHVSGLCLTSVVYTHGNWEGASISGRLFEKEALRLVQHQRKGLSNSVQKIKCNLAMDYRISTKISTVYKNIYFHILYDCYCTLYRERNSIHFLISKRS
jgi:hypothetical protein